MKCRNDKMCAKHAENKMKQSNIVYNLVKKHTFSSSFWCFFFLNGQKCSSLTEKKKRFFDQLVRDIWYCVPLIAKHEGDRGLEIDAHAFNTYFWSKNKNINYVNFKSYLKNGKYCQASNQVVQAECLILCLSAIWRPDQSAGFRSNSKLENIGI